MVTSIANCNDKCTTDMFPNASCLKKPYENKTHDTPFSQSKLHSNIGLALQLFFCSRSFFPSWCSCYLLGSHFIANGFSQMQFTQRTDGGCFTHADNNNKACMTKGLTRFVNHVEMLAVGCLCCEPTFGSRACRALNHLHEGGSHFGFTIASAT